MIKITKLNFDELEIVKCLSSPIGMAKLKCPIIYSREEGNVLDITKLKSEICSNKSVLLLLAKHIFYQKNIVDSEKICSTIHLNEINFEKYVAMFGLIFEKVTYSEVLSEGLEKKLYRVVVGRVSSIGLNAFFDMIDENLIPKEVCDLYVKASLDKSCTNSGLYLVENGCNDIDCMTWWKSLCENEHNNSIDISSMTLDQCKNSELIKFLASNKKKVYIYVEKLPWCNVNIKNVLWY